MRSGFPGFPPAGIQFFRSLARHNNRDWFQPRKHLFEEQVKQPMRELVEAVAPTLATAGFKVLFDILASQKTPPRYLELPYEFRTREAGVSKLDNGVVVQYLGLLIAKLSHDVISPRFVLFALVGASGVGVP